MKAHRIPGIAALILTLLILTFHLASGPACGQDADSSEWEVSATPYWWFVGVDGDLKVNGNETDVDAGFDDVWDAMDFSAWVHMEATNRIWGVFVAPQYTQLSTDKGVSIVNAELDIDMWRVEFGGFYRIAEWETQGRTSALDVLGGGRYWGVETELEIGVLSDKEKSDWVDPFAGLRWTGQMNDWLTLNVRGDVGGFAVYDDASELTWNAIVASSIALSENVSLSAGYRWLYIDWEEDSDSGKDLTFSGPILGLRILF